METGTLSFGSLLARHPAYRTMCAFGRYLAFIVKYSDKKKTKSLSIPKEKEESGTTWTSLYRG
jgi:hypothetical protein